MPHQEYRRLLAQFEPRQINSLPEHARAVKITNRLAEIHNPSAAELAVLHLFQTLVDDFERRYLDMPASQVSGEQL